MIVYDVQLKIHGNTYIPSTINTRKKFINIYTV